MTQNFIFHLNGTGYGITLSFNLEIINGGVVTNKYMPEILSPAFANPIACNMGYNIQNVEEFKNDCQNIVDCFNSNLGAIDYAKLDDWFQVLDALVRSHIESYGRLFLNDLETYTDDICILMAAYGFSEQLVKKYYPKFVLWIADEYSKYVKDGITGLGIIPIKSSPTYKRLLEYCSSI